MRIICREISVIYLLDLQPKTLSIQGLLEIHLRWDKNTKSTFVDFKTFCETRALEKEDRTLPNAFSNRTVVLFFLRKRTFDLNFQNKTCCCSLPDPFQGLFPKSAIFHLIPFALVWVLNKKRCCCKCFTKAVTNSKQMITVREPTQFWKNQLECNQANENFEKRQTCKRGWEG